MSAVATNILETYIPDIMSLTIFEQFCLYTALKRWSNYDYDYETPKKQLILDPKHLRQMVANFTGAKPTWKDIFELATGDDVEKVEEFSILMKPTIGATISKYILLCPPVSSPVTLFRATTKSSRANSAFVTKNAVPDKSKPWINASSKLEQVLDYTAKNGSSSAPKDGIIFEFHIQPGAHILNHVQTLAALRRTAARNIYDESEFYIDLTQSNLYKDSAKSAKGYNEKHTPTAAAPEPTYEIYETFVFPTAAEPHTRIARRRRRTRRCRRSQKN